MRVCYEPRLPPPQAELVLGGAAPEAAEAALLETLFARRDDDIAAGVTRSGPHRDDVRFTIGTQEAGAFASRGEQRTVAIALRLAEVALSRARSGDPPLLLLDDILSELDAARRERVLAAAYGRRPGAADERRPGPVGRRRASRRAALPHRGRRAAAQRLASPSQS